MIRTLTLSLLSVSERMAKDLHAVGIPCTVILDAAVGYIMERVNAVMLGAEGVCENGGIINKVSTELIL